MKRRRKKKKSLSGENTKANMFQTQQLIFPITLSMVIGNTLLRMRKFTGCLNWTKSVFVMHTFSFSGKGNFPKMIGDKKPICNESFSCRKLEWNCSRENFWIDFCHRIIATREAFIKCWPETDLHYSAPLCRFVFGKKLFHSLMNMLARE